MKKYNIFIISIIILFLLGFSTTKSDPFKKLRAFTELIRLVEENYVDEVDINKALNGAFVGLLNELDPHSNFIPIEDMKEIDELFRGDFEGIGIEFSIIDGYITVISPIPDTPSSRAGLQPGDKITKIDGESAYQITQKNVVKTLRGEKGTQVIVTIRRDGEDEEFDATLIRDKIPILSVTNNFMLNNEIGYVEVQRFAEKTYKEFVESIENLEKQGMQKLLLDLRNNGGGLLPQALYMIDKFISTQDTILVTKGRISGSNDVYLASKDRNDKNYPIVVLINRGSASASEIVSGTFQDLDRAIVVGETSFGKGLVQRQYKLNDGSAARITIAKYYTPSGRLIQRSYEDGEDDYYLDLLNDNRDSLDINKPKYYTQSGRTVYGGGGITPDFIVKNDLDIPSDIRNLLFSSKRYIFKYASYLKDNNNISNNYDEWISISNSFVEQSKFTNWLKNQEYDIDGNILSKHWDYVKNRIIAETSGIIWGKEFKKRILLNSDKQVEEALNYFDEAEKLIK